VESGNGYSCSYNRAAFIYFYCGPTLKPQTFTVNDANTGIGCGYIFTVYTSIVCSPPTLNPNIGPGAFSTSTSQSSSSSSLSNGAVAGIVIGVIFGVLILLCLACILYFLAFAGGTVVGKKAAYTDERTVDTSNKTAVSGSNNFKTLSNEPSVSKDVEMVHDEHVTGEEHHTSA